MADTHKPGLEEENKILRGALKEFLRNKGIRRFDTDHVKRDLGNMSKAMGVPAEDIYAVLRPISEELFSESHPVNLFDSDEGEGVSSDKDPT